MNEQELAEAAEVIANEACRAINERAATMSDLIPYKAQALLETVIAILQKRV